VAVRVVIADDVLIVRAGLVTILAGTDVEVVGQAGDADQLLRLVAVERPDVAIVDIRMPPTHRDEGIVAAHAIRSQFPGTAALVLSEYLQARYAERLLADRPAGLGYLLKERVADLGTLLDALARVHAGECVVDPAIVERLLAIRERSPLVELAPRERQALGLIAEGRSNAAVAAHLGIAERSVEALCASLFRKLGLEPDRDVNRRVLAVLAVLRPGRIATP
jgi:DNA-binding NarL/FixJ family response regulator